MDSQITVIEYDQESGDVAIHEIARLFADGWEYLEPLKYHKCCGIYRAVFYK